MDSLVHHVTTRRGNFEISIIIWETKMDGLAGIWTQTPQTLAWFAAIKLMIYIFEWLKNVFI